MCAKVIYTTPTTTTNTYICLYCKWSKAHMTVCNKYSWMKIEYARDICEKESKTLDNSP